VAQFVLFFGKKADELKGERRKTRQEEGGDGGGGARDVGKGEVFLDEKGDESFSRIGKQGGASVGEEGEVLTEAKMGQDLFRGPLFIMEVEGPQGFSDGVVVQEDGGATGVFGEDEIDLLEGLKGS
jgi:hypothetical protein